MQQRLPSLLDRPIGFAHRGGRAHAPENTLEAFELALRLGATGLETDVWLTSDGVPVISHDGTFRAGLRSRHVRDVPRRSLPDSIATLEQLVDRCGHTYHLSIDLKDPASGSAVIDVLRNAGGDLIERTWLCHPTFSELVALRTLHSGVKLIDSSRLDRIKEGVERRVAVLAELGIDGLNMYHTDWTGGLTTLAHRFRRVAFSWGIEYDRHFQAAYRMGVDAVYSDWVDRMMDSYRAELGQPGL